MIFDLAEDDVGEFFQHSSANDGRSTANAMSFSQL